MATAFFGGNFFGGEFFSVSQVVAPDAAVKTGTGGIDPGDGVRRIIKPTGLLDRQKEGRKNVADRVDDSRDIQAEVAAQIAREFGEENERLAIEEMSMAQIEAEIGFLLRKKLRTENDDLLLLLLMAVAAAV